MGRVRRIEHGLTKTKEYMIWCNIKQRCRNTKCKTYRLYGGRGIDISNDWHESFLKFMEDMGPRPTPNHSVDRINPELGYNKHNCRWATTKEQNLNRKIAKKENGLPRGVHITKHGTIFSSIRINGKNYYLGSFKSADLAYMEYLKVYEEWFGKAPEKLIEDYRIVSLINLKIKKTKDERIAELEMENKLLKQKLFGAEK